MNALESGSGGAALAAAGLMWSARLGLLLAGAWFLAAVLARASAAVRHRVWAAALAAALLLPLIAAASPWRWQVPLLPASATAGAEVGAGSIGRPVPGRDLAIRSRDAFAGGGEEPAASPPPPRAVGGLGADGLLLLVWAAGTLIALAVAGLGTLRLAALARAAAAPATAGFEARLRRLSARVGVRQRVRVRESPQVTVPLTRGILRPEILLPSGASTAWPPSRLDAVLMHELAHVRRRDVAAHALGRLVCALHWFNPLAWVAAGRMAREAERASDDLVLLAGTRASAYAGHLLEFVRSRGRRPLGAVALCMARRSELEGRILALLDPAVRRGPLRRGAGALTVAAALGLALLVSLPEAGAGEPPPTAPEEAGGGEAAAAGRAPAERVERTGGQEAPPVTADASRYAATDRALVATLLGLLDDPDAGVREAAARSAGERGLVEAVPGLVAALADEEPDVREEAALALGHIGDAAAVDPLARALARDPDDDVREAAAWALGETESLQAVVRLAEALERTGDDALRAELVDALGETGRMEAVGVLEARLAAADRRLQRRILGALVEVGSSDALDVVVRTMGSDDANLRRMAAQALGEG